MFYIYGIINVLNNKLYIGKTNDIKRRWREHKYISKGGIEKYGEQYRTIHAAINKYGLENFSFFEILSIEDENDAYFMEAFMIEFCDSKIFGYNEAWGGKGTLCGINNPMFGKTHTSEAKAIMSAQR